MKELILENLANPHQLEKLYRENKAEFKREFSLLYPEIQGDLAAQIWNERLNFETKEAPRDKESGLAFVVVASFLAGFIAKIPDVLGIGADFFYPRNMSFVVFPFLAAYFLRRRDAPLTKIAAVGAAIAVATVYINLLPDNLESHTLVLACIHLPLIIWALFGYAFVGTKPGSNRRRLDFLRYNGDLCVMSGIILIAGGLLTLLTLGLFSLINVNIHEFYTEYIVVWGIASAPIVATFLIEQNPHLVNKVSPVIAKVFTPLVLITLVFYLFAVIGAGKDPYNDREFLLMFNFLLIGVMALILFSVAEYTKEQSSRGGVVLLLALSGVTVIINSIAVSAILFRIAEWGFSPNRVAVLGGNILILANLLLVAQALFKVARYGRSAETVEQSIASFLPVYIVWAIFVTFVFPLIFNFR